MDGVGICELCGSMLSDPKGHICDHQVLGYKQPVFKWEIRVGGERGVGVSMETEPPNIVQRFMYKLLLGWEIKLL